MRSDQCILFWSTAPTSHTQHGSCRILPCDIILQPPHTLNNSPHRRTSIQCVQPHAVLVDRAHSTPSNTAVESPHSTQTQQNTMFYLFVILIFKNRVTLHNKSTNITAGCMMNSCWKPLCDYLTLNTSWVKEHSRFYSFYFIFFLCNCYQMHRRGRLIEMLKGRPECDIETKPCMKNN